MLVLSGQCTIHHLPFSRLWSRGSFHQPWSLSDYDEQSLPATYTKHIAEGEVNLGCIKPLRFGDCFSLKHNLAYPDKYRL